MSNIFDPVQNVMDAEKWIYAEYNEMLKTHKNVKALAIAANKNDAAGDAAAVLEEPARGRPDPGAAQSVGCRGR